MKPIKFNLHKVAIVGRPNVGKSALFNRIIQKRKAIVEKDGPTTRDRIGAIVSWSNKNFELIDTPGLDFGKKENLWILVEKQIMLAIKEADQFIFVCDVSDGISQFDHKICSMLRKAGKKVTLVINKADTRELSERKAGFYSLGFGEPLPVSALHGLGIGDLLDAVISGIEDAEKHLPRISVRIAIIGRPNAGKSSFVNSLLGEDRITVSDVPGTTRDSINTYFERDKKSFIIIDTAGIRSKSKIKDAVTYFSILRTEESIKKSDVTVILADAPMGVRKEEHKIIDLVQENFKPFILAINKWDLAEKDKIRRGNYEKTVREEVRFMYNAPIIFISALKGENLLSVIDTAYELAEKSRKNFSTSDLNMILKAIQFNATRLYSIRQVKNSPPGFEIIVKSPEAILNTEKSHLVNVFRKKLNLEGVPVVIKFKRKMFKSR